jgi:hypothetical protein
MGAGIGFATGAIFVLREVLIVQSNPLFTFKPNAGAIYLGIVAGTMGLGAIIGVGSPKWKTYYLGNQKISNVRIIPDYDVASTAFGIRMRCNFR